MDESCTHPFNTETVIECFISLTTVLETIYTRICLCSLVYFLQK